VQTRVKFHNSRDRFAPIDGYSRTLFMSSAPKCPEPNKALVEIAGKKAADGVERAIGIEIVVAAVEKPHQVFRFIGKIE
jgi:hypothetical protein